MLTLDLFCSEKWSLFSPSSLRRLGPSPPPNPSPRAFLSQVRLAEIVRTGFLHFWILSPLQYEKSPEEGIIALLVLLGWKGASREKK